MLALHVDPITIYCCGASNQTTTINKFPWKINNFDAKMKRCDLRRQRPPVCKRETSGRRNCQRTILGPYLYSVSIECVRCVQFIAQHRSFNGNANWTMRRFIFARVPSHIFRALSWGAIEFIFSNTGITTYDRRSEFFDTVQWFGSSRLFAKHQNSMIISMDTQISAIIVNSVAGTICSYSSMVHLVRP